MNNKVNIFEELNKMKSLIHAKSGTVISEQLTANQKLAKDKGFGNVTVQMADQLVKSGQLTADIAPILPAQATAARDEARDEANKDTNATPRQKNINFNYCSVKNGKIETTKSAFNGTTFDEYVSTYTITPEEIAVAKASCPNVDVSTPGGYKFGDDLSKALNIQGKDDTQKSNTQKGDTNAVNTRFTKSATDLGLQSGKMDLQTLQSILAKLQDDGSQSTVTQDTSTTTQETPDLAQLTALLNQLKA
jgi:hypothetical protein